MAGTSAAPPTAYERVAAALAERGTPLSGAGKAHCPAHDDRVESLSVNRGDDRAVVLHCHARCEPAAVLEALDLPADLLSEPAADGGTGRWRTVGRYKYADPATGKHLFTQIRKERGTEKRYVAQPANVQERMRKAGTLPLYGEARLAEARQNEWPVYLVEGEGNADRLQAWADEDISAPDLVAVSHVNGASAWHSFYAERFTGLDVTVVVDRDGPGQAWAAAVEEDLRGVAKSLRFVQSATTGKGHDIVDHLDAGHGLDDLVAYQPVAHHEDSERRLVLTPASAIRPKPVRWLWEGRLALGTLGLLAGREGLGKSTLSYWLAAQITRGELPGDFRGEPKAVLVAATEDSWEHTIVPRLIAADADLSRVYQVEVVSAQEVHLGLTLPRDLAALDGAAREKDAALLVLDPLMSRLPDLDTHKDSEVRIALEPLVALADRARMAVLGLIHHNKSGSTDPLQLVMGSRAFTAVARSVHTVVPDPEDEEERRRLFGTPKNNLAADDAPTLAFTIEPYVIETEEGDAVTGRLVWGGESRSSIREAMATAADDDRSATAEAADWLVDYLESVGGSALSAEIKKAGRAVGHSGTTLKCARVRAGVTVGSEGFPRQTTWSRPVGPQSDRPLPRGDGLTGPTGPTVDSRSQSDQSDQSDQSPGKGGPTGRRAHLRAVDGGYRAEWQIK